MPKTLQKILLVVVSFALFCSGCSRQEPPPYSGVAKKIVIATPKGESAGVVYALEHLGYAQQLGIDLKVQEVESGVAAVAALNEGLVDLAVASDFVFVGNVEKHQELRIAAAVNSCTNTYILARKDRGIIRPADLKGKRIAVTSGSVAEYILGKYLYSNRLQMEEVSLVDMDPSMMEKEIVAGSIDAAIVWDPVARRIQKSLGENGVSWQAQSERSYLMVLIGRDSFMKREAAGMVRLMQSLIMAEKSIAADPVAVQNNLAQRFKMPGRYFVDVWGDNRFTVTLDRRLMLSLEEESRWIHGAQGGKDLWTPNYLQYIYFDALTAARPESVSIIR